MAINTTGYSSNQFLGIENFETSITKIGRKPTDNPEFQFPGKLPPNIYDEYGDRSKGNTPVQRGFIRGIFPEVVNAILAESEKDTKTSKVIKNRYTGLNKDTAPTRRCFFQFNPSLILRSVQASTTTLNPLLQNPNQLLQPIPGQASFEFQLLFNREHEVAAQEYVTPNGTSQPTSPLTANLAAYGAALADKGLPYSHEQLGDLGVLVDLYVLDSIIGQSITADSMQSIQAYWEATKNLRPSDEVDDKGKPVQPYAKEVFVGENSKYVDSLKKVLGNSAFLNPMPIRIVFSSLFMVEGFVTASNVAFHKFSRNMVPTVCQVTLSVQAMYIGFAKKDSYVTAQLTEAIKGDVEEDEETSKNIAACKVLLNKHVQVDIENIKYSTRFINAIQGNNNAPLNSWFKQWYESTAYKDEDNAFNFNTYAGDPSNQSLKAWTSPVYKTDAGKSCQNARIHSIDILFYDASKMPKNYDTEAKLVAAAEKGKLKDGTASGLTYQARSRVFWINSNGNPIIQDIVNAGTTTATSNKIETASRESKYSMDWLGQNIKVDGIKDGATDAFNVNKYFGDKVFVLIVVTLSGESKKGGGGDNVTNYVYKAQCVALNPVTEGITNDKLKNLTFGAR